MMSGAATNSRPVTNEQMTEVANRKIADLVEQVPATMPVFSALGLDLCCGGGHPLGEALSLHGIEAAPVLQQVAQIVADSQGR